MISRPPPVPAAAALALGAAAANRAAMILAIRKAEGTDGPDGYRIMFGGRHFVSYKDHPRSPARFFDRRSLSWKWSSAAGAGQFMAVSPIPGGGSTLINTWDRLAKKLKLPDFTPASQDRAMVELFRERGALDDIDAGRFDIACRKLRREWASLPDAGYGQPERTLAFLRTAFVDAGGTLA